MLSQCVQYPNASKFTAGFQHFPFIVLYRFGDTHWSRRIILFIIEHYPTHSIIRFISCPACLQPWVWADVRADIKEQILPSTWCDNIHEAHFIWGVDAIWVCCAWEKHLTFCRWHRQTSSYRNSVADSISLGVAGQLNMKDGGYQKMNERKTWRQWLSNTEGFIKMHKLNLWLMK